MHSGLQIEKDAAEWAKQDELSNYRPNNSHLNYYDQVIKSGYDNVPRTSIKSMFAAKILIEYHRAVLDEAYQSLIKAENKYVNRLKAVITHKDTTRLDL